MAIIIVIFSFADHQSTSAVGFNNTTGDKTITEPAVIDGDQWIKGGDLTIGPGSSLQINPGSSFQFEPTHKIIMDGGQIFQSISDGIIKKGNVDCECVSGACCDGCNFLPAEITCGYSTYNDCNGSCQKKRDVYECTGAAATCPNTDQGNSYANVANSGYICSGGLEISWRLL